MKKFLAIALAALMLVSVFACDPTEQPDPTTPTDTTEPTEDPTTTDEPDPTTDPTVERENQIIYGSGTEIGGDWGRAMWTNGATDNMIIRLTEDYDTVTTDKEGDYVVNPSIVDGDITSVINADGTKTFTVKIKQGLVYNNGDPITAQDYVASTMFACSALAQSMAVRSTAASMVAGGEAFQSGAASVLSGLRLIDEYTISVTITQDYLPYYYDISYAGFSPMQPAFWFGEGWTIKDDGEGCYFAFVNSDETVDETKVFASPATEARVMIARYQSFDRVSAGPYQLVEFNKTALTATLVKNPNYVGNFEGQIPSIEKIIITKAEEATWLDMIKTGGFDFYDTITDGKEIDAAIDLIEEGGAFDYVQFDRAGYGKILFICDFGPTQFLNVRKAIAHLLDRRDFANTFCDGWGGVVHGPYGIAMQTYKDSTELFAEELDTYEYSYDAAVELLVEDGWTLDVTGAAYESGIRYKEVTNEQAGTYAHNVTLADGRILMPLIIEWACSENNAVSDLIDVKLCQNENTANAGVQINRNIMTFSELLNYMYRQSTDGSTADDYSIPKYNMMNLATSWNAAVYDPSYDWTMDPTLIAQGYNYIRLMDEQLDKLSMDMVYGIEAGDYDTYLDLWQQYIIRWNELLPELPLYSNVYISMFPSWLKGYEQNSFWGFEEAILYATVEGAKAE